MGCSCDVFCSFRVLGDAQIEVRGTVSNTIFGGSAFRSMTGGLYDPGNGATSHPYLKHRIETTCSSYTGVCFGVCVLDRLSYLTS